MLNFTFNIKCKCGANKSVKIKQEKNQHIISCFTEAIESNSDGLFYCLENYPNGFDLVCTTCGGETFMQLTS